MKKVRVLALVVTVLMVIFAFTGCKQKEYKEVYIKTTDNEIMLLSETSQQVTIEVTIIDGETEMIIEKSIPLFSNEASTLKLSGIIDTSFLSDNAQITNVSVVKQGKRHLILNEYLAILLASVLVFGLIAIIADRNKF